MKRKNTMNKNIYLKSLQVLITLGVLLSLAGPSAVQARIPIDGAAQSSALLPENVKPVAMPDVYYLDLSVATKLIVPAPGVLGNDYDPDGTPITAVNPSPPANGNLILRSDGSFEYTPDSGFSGDDIFTYKASDGTLTSTPAQVTVSVTGGNTVPVANADNYTLDVSISTTLTVAAPGVLLNDTDADGDPMTAVKMNDPAHGSVSLLSTGAFTYTSTQPYVGDDIFTYKACDGPDSCSTPVQVTITVSGGNEAPDANADSYTLDLAIAPTLIVAAPGVLGNDYDYDGPNPITAVIWVQPINGGVNLHSDGSFEYIPHPGYYGTDTFTYKAFDGELYSSPANVTITVEPINTAPIAVAEQYSIVMNESLVVAAPGVLANDVDLDLDPLTAVLVGSPASFGYFNLDSNGGFTFIPTMDYVGTVYFTYKAYDGIDYSTPVQVSIEVTSVNTPPVAMADSYTMLMDTTLDVSAADGVLTNDYDANDDPLTAELLGVPVVNGVLLFNADGSFVYTPNAGNYGTIYFTYWVTDGLDYSTPVTVAIIIKQSNLAPLAVMDEYETPAYTTLNVLVADGVLANDSDPDGDTLETLLVDSTDFGLLSLHLDGSFVYVPSLGFSGVDSFRYRAFDGLAVSNEVLVTITVGEAVNMAPVGLLDAYIVRINNTLTVAAPGVLTNDYDVNGDAITAVLGTDVSHGTLTFNSNGSFTYVPVTDFDGLDQFTYQAYDGELYSTEVTVTITVVDNIAPVGLSDAYVVRTDTTLSVAAPGVLTNDYDVDGDALTAVLGADVSHGNLIFRSDGSFAYLPDAGFLGVDTFTYRVYDGELYSTYAMVTITVVTVAYIPITLK
jgi:VCBS repeat-containing protein